MNAEMTRGMPNAGGRTRLPSGHRLLVAAGVLMATCTPIPALAHAWNIPYYLPIPLWLYAYGAAGTLILSFLILVFAPGSRIPRTGSARHRANPTLLIRATLIDASQVASAVFIVFLIVAGIVGTQDPFINITMSGFWVWFYLGSIYISALFGDIYSLVNPFALIPRIAERCIPGAAISHFLYPQRLAAYPALLAYIALISLELFGSGRPRDASLFLVGYGVSAIAVSFCFGREVWIAHFDVFGILCRLCAKLSPFDWHRLPGGRASVRLRNPIRDLASAQPLDRSMICFLSFMLSSTAYDGLHDTAVWNDFFWRDIYPHVIRLLPELGNGYAWAAQMILAWQWTSFAATALAYYVLFRGFCALGALCSHSSLNAGSFAQQFGLLLLPIALFYNVCHYFTMCLDQGRQILSLASDPLGLGWTLLPFSNSGYAAISQVINLGYIWHVQIFLVLLGHVLSVCVAHATATRHPELAISTVANQLPLLALTIVLTIAGLWILSLPLA